MSSSMRFRALGLRNWKNFAQADVELGDRAFLVGPNASGKSNFLDALRFLRDLASSGGGLQEAVRRRGGLSSVRCLAARRYPDVELHAEGESSPGGPRWHYEIAIRQDNQRRPLLRKERVVVEGREVLSRPTPQDDEDEERLTQTYLEQVNANREFRELAGFFASIRYLHLVPQLVREPDRSVGRVNDPFGGDFLELVARTPDRTRNSRFERIRKALQVAVPQLEAIELSRDDRGTPHLRGKYQHWRPQGAWQTEEQFSDGTLRLFGLLWAVMEGGGPLLLEEPELSLHPEIVRQLPQLLARLPRRMGRQVFLSTHSSDLLSDEGIALHEVLLLIPGEEGTEVRPATALEDAKVLLEGGLSLAEVVMPRVRPSQARQLALFGED